MKSTNNKPHRPTVVAWVLLAVAQLAIAHEAEPDGQQQRPAEPPADAPTDEPAGLPRVLLIGDSISMGYTATVRELLAGKAEVRRVIENCGPTTRGLARLDQWLGDEAWDVIHFNFGLHDLKYVNDAGQRTDPERGRQQVPPAQYEQNLHRIVQRLRETDATLIWCTTTPVPEGAAGRRSGDAATYNAIAARVMRMTLGEQRIINDLYAVAQPQLAAIQQRANVHFLPAGSQLLGQQVARVIQQHLPQPEPANRPTATGIVYHDVNGNRTWDAADHPLPGLRVSNGQDITKTDSDGRYQLPVDEDTILFVIKPCGWRAPLSPDMLPQFYYIHKPNGSPEFTHRGVPATGPLPKSIDFPLYPHSEPARFKALLFGDPQVRNEQEVAYMAHDVVEELIGTDATFGVTLGDIVFDNPDLLQSQAHTIAVLGIPWHNVLGNHDINYDARRDRDSDESFERVFGPSYYSFDYGPVHFLVLDDIEWLIDEDGEARYQGGLGPRQLDFVQRDLELIPADQLVVLMMHIPLVQVRDRHALYRLIEQRPFCMSISAHQHYHQHRFITQQDGWHGPQPHHHVINVTVSGSWWAGMADERGIPHTLMADGAPNGYSIINFDDHQYQLEFKAAGRPADYQMNIYAPDVIQAADLQRVPVLVNVFNGSSQSTVAMRVGNTSNWLPMQPVEVEDPAYRRVFAAELAIRDRVAAQGGDPDVTLRKLTDPKVSTHIWRATLPAELAPGTHCIEVRTTDMHRRTFTGHRILRVTAD